MTDTTYVSTAGSLRDRVAGRIASARTGYGKWRVYRQTLNELTALTDRDLADLGLHRGEIDRIARDAAYGL